MHYAIVCAAGIGDGLITSIAAHNLRRHGHKATLFNPHLASFGNYLEEGTYLSYPLNWKQTLLNYDAILLQHEDTLRAKEVLSLRNSLPVYCIYTNYRPSKHGPLLPGFDYPVNEGIPMMENLQLALQHLFSISPSPRNCLQTPAHLTLRKYPHRVLIHPTSANPDKNWKPQKFLKLAKKLEQMKLDPVFILALHERNSWPKEINAPHFATLEDLTNVIYESGCLIGNDSGPAHIASYFEIPHIVICQGRQMPLWRTGWHPGTLVTPPRFIPNLKGMRLREHKWAEWISVNRVLKELPCFLDPFSGL